MTDIMGDLKPLGLRPGAAILSSGACGMDKARMHDKQHQFDQNVTRTSQTERGGFHVLPDTVEWWKKQSDAARNALLANPANIRRAPDAFHAWAERCAEPRFFW